MPAPRRHLAVCIALSTLLAGCGWDPVPVASRAPSLGGGSDSWTELPSMASGRLWPVTVALDDGRALSTGGVNQFFDDASFAEIYDPAGGASPWTVSQVIDPARDTVPYKTAFHYAIKLRNGKILMFGGDASAFLGDQRAYLFDPTTGAWTRTADDLPVPFGGGIGVNGVLLPNGDVFVAGGYTPNFPVANDAAAIYEVEADHWVGGLRPLPRAVAHNALLALDDGRVLVVGGGGGPGGQDGFDDATVNCPMAVANAPCPNAQIYDPRTGHWRRAHHQMPGIPGEEVATDPRKRGGRQWPVVLPLGDGRVLVAGGTTIDTSGAEWVVKGRKSALVFDPSSETWTLVGSMHVVKAEASTYLLESDGTPLLLPGWDEACFGNRISERFDRSSMSFTALEGLFPSDGVADPCFPGSLRPVIHMFGTNAAMLSDGRALVVGGQDPNLFVPSARAFVYVPPARD